MCFCRYDGIRVALFYAIDGCGRMPTPPVTEHGGIRVKVFEAWSD